MAVALQVRKVANICWPHRSDLPLCFALLLIPGAAIVYHGSLLTHSWPKALLANQDSVAQRS